MVIIEGINKNIFASLVWSLGNLCCVIWIEQYGLNYFGFR